MSSPFLRLPAEMKNEIYELVATHDSVDDPAKINLKNGRTDGNFSSLSRVCQEIREQYLPIQEREYSIYIEYRHLLKWINKIYIVVCLEDYTEFVNILLMLRLQAQMPNDTHFEIEITDPDHDYDAFYDDILKSRKPGDDRVAMFDVREVDEGMKRDVVDLNAFLKNVKKNAIWQQDLIVERSVTELELALSHPNREPESGPVLI